MASEPCRASLPSKYALRMSRESCENSPPDHVRRAVAVLRHVFRVSFTHITPGMAAEPFIEDCRYGRSGVVSHTGRRTRLCAVRRRSPRTGRRPAGRRKDHRRINRFGTAVAGGIGVPRAGLRVNGHTGTEFWTSTFGACVSACPRCDEPEDRPVAAAPPGEVPGMTPITPTERPPQATRHRSDQALSGNRYTRGRSTGAFSRPIPDSGSRTNRQPSHRGQ